MRYKKNIKFTVLAVIICIATMELKAETIHQWDVYTISFKSKNIYDNPYINMPTTSGDDLLKVTFQGVDGDALNKKISVVGFWNGGSEWCVRFSPPFTGKWKYVSVSTDKSLNGIKGSLNVIPWTEEEKAENSTRRGLVKVRDTGENSGRFFEYSDGQPFLWIGDTWWRWTKPRIEFDTFKQLVDDRAEKGFTVGQLFFPFNTLQARVYTVLDLEHVRRIDKMIQYANSKGITVWIHGWWGCENMKTRFGSEDMRRWIRYLIHRYGAYNVIWVVTGEYNLYNNGGFSLDYWNDLGSLIKNEDPYNRLVSIHNTPPFWTGGAEAPQWAVGEVFQKESWLDFNQSQVGHGKYANEMIPVVVTEEYARQPIKPIVVTEPWYEFIEGSASGKDIRFGAWSAILSGAAGHTYGGGHVWIGHVPESPETGGEWPLDTSFDCTTYNYEGAVSMKHLITFFKKIKWWEMEPHPELIEYPQSFCLAKPNEEYVIYLRYGGEVKIKMDNSKILNNYTYQWFNPSSGEYGDIEKVQVDDVLTLKAPESYPTTLDLSDWVLYIQGIAE